MSDYAVILENIVKNFGSKTDAVNGVSLQIEKGSLTIVGGANGSGKSVLMTVIAGLSKPSQGKVTTSSKPGLVFQDAATQLLGETPFEDVCSGPRNLGFDKKEIPQIAEKALREVRLWEKARFPSEFLSGGEKRRLAVASILAMKRDIIIFDEPYANLDYPGVLDVNRLLLQLREQKKTVLLLTHEIEKCLAFADHFVILQSGKKVFDGLPADALKLDLTQWGIKNPLQNYTSLEDLAWR